MIEDFGLSLNVVSHAEILRENNRMPSKPTLLSKFVRDTQGISWAILFSMHIIHFMTKVVKQAPICVIV